MYIVKSHLNNITITTMALRYRMAWRLCSKSGHGNGRGRHGLFVLKETREFGLGWGHAFNYLRGVKKEGIWMNKSVSG